MFAAVMTSFCFALSSVTGNRAVKILGSAKANLVRLSVAFLVLALYAHSFGQGLQGAALEWMLFSGMLGMGVGDIALYMSFPYLGPRLALTLTQCLAPPFAALIEWLWLGTALSTLQLTCGSIILLGIAIALFPKKAPAPADKAPVSIKPFGIFLGCAAALGQAAGAVVSRRGYVALSTHGEHLDGISATYQRIIGGVVVCFLYYVITRGKSAAPKTTSGAPGRRRWVLPIVNAFPGAVFGVSFYQWALATTPSGVVLAIVATSPIAVIPLAYLIDGEKPSTRSTAGGCIAVGGAVWLALNK